MERDMRDKDRIEKYVESHYQETIELLKNWRSFRHLPAARKREQSLCWNGCIILEPMTRF